jgi:hypothetical protein
MLVLDDAVDSCGHAVDRLLYSADRLHQLRGLLAHAFLRHVPLRDVQPVLGKFGAGLRRKCGRTFGAEHGVGAGLRRLSFLPWFSLAYWEIFS